MLKVYLAGPEVFLPDAITIGAEKKRVCADYGFQGLFPFDNEVSPDESGRRIDMLIYRANTAMMHEADFGILNLTPFRGPSADVGTVFELGMLVGLGKPAFGYTNDDSDLLMRMRRVEAAEFDMAAQVWRDAGGMTIENFGNSDNLMIDAALNEQGTPMVRHRAAPEEAFRDVTGFRACLELAAERLRRPAVGWIR
jgi:nucleoside 2-deoxyribosyltransferase